MSYRKGRSGNPNGRPKGIADKRTALRTLLAPHAQALIDKTVKLAKGGDTTPLRLCLERIMAPIRAKDESARIDQPGTTLIERGESVMDASLRGQIRSCARLPTSASSNLSAC
jgi:hypothetical protein